MNHHHQTQVGGPGNHMSSQRRQDYTPYQHHAPPSHYHYQAPYYPAPPPHYQAPRWHQQYSPIPQQHFVPPPQIAQAPYQPRSPMVVSSQPQLQSLPPRPNFPPQPSTPQYTQSPRPIPLHLQRSNPPATSPLPATTISPASIGAQVAEEKSATPPVRRPSIVQNPLLLPPEHKQPFWPQLPWYSVPEGATGFPARAHTRRRRRRNIRNSNNAVALPTREELAQENGEQDNSRASVVGKPPSESSTIAAPSEPETPATSQAPSESEFTQASTPTTPAQVFESSPKSTPTNQHTRRNPRPAIAVPHISGLPKSNEIPQAASGLHDPAVSDANSSPKTEEPAFAEASAATLQATESMHVADGAGDASSGHSSAPKPALAPKSWAELLRRNATNVSAHGLTNGAVPVNGVQLPQSASLADALKQYDVQHDTKLSFLEPRGLVNTGNMCYMNSILQVLVFSTPFYNFLDQVRQRTIQSMKSDTPLVDAMIMFMREFKVLGSAESTESLRSSLKPEQLEAYGDSVTPDYVYDVIRKLPRFASMRRGHQQDAEEFLGFLLEGLHDECAFVMRSRSDEHSTDSSVTPADTIVSPNLTDGWLEVGPKQKPSITRTAGQQDASTPITKIFGGHLRSELRVPGLKDSVTLEPYQPLQLDIDAPHVNNIIDALKGLTRIEALTGDFGGKSNLAKKQVFIDDLPPVLILHLKRFKYDSNLTGTQKIWKKVGYPLELDIPKEVFAPTKRNGLQVKGLPRYRLTSVVYHHGKSAAGGHYTVDVLRQDSKEWVRMDDTVIRRIRPEDVAEGGAEEDPKLLAKALEQHKADQDLQKQRNMYQGLDDEENGRAEEKPWSEVNGHPTSTSKKWSGVVNGSATPASTTSGKRTPTTRKEGVRDNKVAYILLYERIRG